MAPDISSTGPEADHLDGPILAELEDIMEDDFGVLIETYIEDAVGKLTQIDDALASSDAPTLRELSHSLKGASCNIGALPLSRLFETMELLAKDRKVNDIGPLIPGIRTEFSTIKTLLEAKLN